MIGFEILSTPFVLLGFFYFCQRHGSPKLMVPPKGITKWKIKFFYIKAVAVTAKLTFRNVTDTIIADDSDKDE
ncbi:hypothetical protein Hdeb2414_s0016g00485681 [Helianthus debilis subsp. tardiflorus]